MTISDELSGKVSLVTGGSGDIGGAIAKATGKPAPQPPSSKDNEGLE